MIAALLLAALAGAAQPRPLLWTATATHVATHGMGPRSSVIIFGRGAAGGSTRIASRINYAGLTAFSSWTLTAVGTDYTVTVPACRWILLEQVAVTGWVRYRARRSGVDWGGRFGTAESALLMPEAAFPGAVGLEFRTDTPGSIVNIWCGN